MDEFEKDFGFDWKHTPSREHPENCKCPIHEFMAEQFSNTGVRIPTIQFCTQHYNMLIRSFNKMESSDTKILEHVINNGMLNFVRLPAMASVNCYYCRFSDDKINNY